MVVIMWVYMEYVERYEGKNDHQTPDFLVKCSLNQFNIISKKNRKIIRILNQITIGFKFF